MQRVLIFRLNNVPDDEADDIRELLAGHGIDFYETDAGRWGISVAAIWLKDDARLEEARRLIDAYQHAREARIKAEYAALRREGKHETLVGRVCRAPLRFLFYAAVIVAILFITLSPFLRRW